MNTSKLTRRKLRFETIDDLLAELDRIEQAERSGQLKAHGNWSAGQIVSHIAAWVEYGWIGYPVKPPPFFIRWILKLMLRKILRSGMSAGVKIPGTKEGTFGQDEVPVQQAMDRLRSCLNRLRDGEQAKFDSPGFGPMSLEDRIRLNLRHAELHLSFLTY